MVAAAIEAERVSADGGGGAVLMPWPTVGAAVSEQASAVASLARFLRLGLVEPRLAPPSPEAGLSPGLPESVCLLAALHSARSLGCERVVWPFHVHSDHQSIAGELERIAAAVDRAQLIGRLSLLEGTPVVVDAPLADLTDGQLADLAIDLDAPAYLAWWWRSLGSEPAERVAAEERRAWLPVLRDAGWLEAPVVRTPAAGERVEPGAVA